MYSWSQVIWLSGFLALLFIFLVFGETTYSLPFWGVMVLWCAWPAWRFGLEWRSRLRLPAVLVSAWLLVAISSLGWTISLPLTAASAAFTAVGGVVFTFILLRRRHWLPTPLLLLGLLGLTVSLAVLTFVFTLLPVLQTNLPSATLLTAFYGHNLAAMLFLLLLPVAWIWAADSQHWAARGAAVIILAATFLSFSRVAMVLAGLELLILWRLSHDAFMRRLAGGAVLVSLAAVAGVVLLSLGPILRPNWCPLPIWQSQLCKPVHIELRPAYWQQAITAWSARPLWGWGGGTFPLLSPRYQQRSGEYSGYPHNEVLQILTSYGLLGGVIVIVFLGLLLRGALSELRQGLFQRSSRTVGSTPTTVRLRLALAVGILAVCCWAMFSFSWQMLGLWVSFMAVVACWWREWADGQPGSQPALGSWPRMVQLPWLIAGAGVVAWSSLFVLSSIWWSAGRAEAAFRLFPFADWRLPVVLSQANDWSPATRTQLFTWYREHYRFWVLAAEQPGVSAAAQRQYLAAAIHLDPLAEQRRYRYLLLVLDSQDWPLIEATAHEWVTLTQQQRLQTLSYQEQQQVALRFVTIANLRADQDLAQSWRLVTLAGRLQPEIVVAQPAVVLRRLEQLPVNTWLPVLAEFGVANLWPYERELVAAQLAVLRHSLRTGEPELARQVTGLLSTWPGYDWLVHEQIWQEWRQLERQLISASPDTSAALTPARQRQLLAFEAAVTTWTAQQAGQHQFTAYVTAPLRQWLLQLRP